MGNRQLTQHPHPAQEDTMLEYDGPANSSIVTGVPIWARRAKTTPPTPINASTARDKGVVLPNQTVAGLTLTAKVFVEYNKFPDLHWYGSYASSKNWHDKYKIRKAVAAGHLIVHRRVGPGEYDTWISPDPIRQPRVACRYTSSCGSRGYVNRDEARGPAYEGALARQRALYERLANDEVGASIVTIRLYLHGTEIANAYDELDLGSWKEEDHNLAYVVLDMMDEAVEAAETWITNMRAALCPCQGQAGSAA